MFGIFSSQEKAGSTSTIHVLLNDEEIRAFLNENGDFSKGRMCVLENFSAYFLNDKS